MPTAKPQNSSNSSAPEPNQDPATSFPVVYRRKIRFSDTDAQGIVFNANYLVYFDDTITDYFDALGMPWSEFTEHGYEMVLGRVEVDFRSSARVGDRLATGARVARFGRTSIHFELLTWDEATLSPVVEGKQVQVMVDSDTFRPTPVPDFFRQAVFNCQEVKG